MADRLSGFGTLYTPELRSQIIAHAVGKTVVSLEYVDGTSDGWYWVMTFDDGSEMAFRFMTEIIAD